jgi:hypothetical protein
MLQDSQNGVCWRFQLLIEMPHHWTSSLQCFKGLWCFHLQGPAVRGCLFLECCPWRCRQYILLICQGLFTEHGITFQNIWIFRVVALLEVHLAWCHQQFCHQVQAHHTHTTHCISASVSRGTKIGDSTLMEIFQACVSVWGLRLLQQFSLCLQSSGMLHGVGRRPRLSVHLIRCVTV